MRLLLLTTIMAPYRIPVFNELANIDGVTLRVVYLAESAPHRDWLAYRDEMRFDHVVLNERHRFVRDETWVHLSTGLGREVWNWKPSVVLAGGWDQPLFAGAYALRRALGYGFALWVESNERDVRRESGIADRMKRRMIAGSGGIAVAGSASARYVEHLGARSDVIFVAPNAVDTAFFARHAPSSRADRSGPVRYLFVGRMHHVKGLDWLLDAWKAMPSGHELTLIGVGPLEGHVQSRIASEQIGGVRMVGHLQRFELATAYADADVFVFPSLSDPWGLVLNEAMAAELPIVSSTMPGAVDDMVVDGENGLVVPPNDVAALTKAMQAMSDASRRHEMGAASKRMIERFSPLACARGLAAAARTAQVNAC